MADESYGLAVDWVLGQLNAQLRNAGDKIGRLILHANGLDKCDCVPVDLRDAKGRRWRLLSVASSEVSDLTATYEHIEGGDDERRLRLTRSGRAAIAKGRS